MDKKKENITTEKNKKEKIPGEKNNDTELKIKKEDKTKKSSSAKDKTSKKKKETTNKEVEKLKEQISEINDKYLRLSAEYDNYRKRTLREKMELTKIGGEDILLNILPIVDDFERAMNSIDKVKDINTMKEGISLIYNKFIEFLKSRGIKEIEAINQKFSTDEHEALTKIPAPNKKLKGKVVDVIEKGYFLHDKVIRYSKVVIGE